MSQKDSLIQAIRNKCAGLPYDVEFYIRSMDSIMKQAYAYLSRSTSAFMGPDLDTFMNRCWDKLENGKLVLKLADISVGNDTHLRNYTRKAFENLLKEMLSTYSPGFRARQKQIERVLMPICARSCRKFCGCWKLTELRGKVCLLVSKDQLKQIAASIPAPRFTAQRNLDSRAPSMRDNHMALYLCSILKAAGGLVKQEDLLAVITSQLNILGVREYTPLDDGTQQDFSSAESVILGADHEAMAMEIVQGMDHDMMEIYYYRIAKELTIQQTARLIGKSLGTVHNREASCRKYLARYFTKDEWCSMEEMSAVLNFVTGLVLRIKEES